MTQKPIDAFDDDVAETGVILKWGKLITRITAISATLTGAFAALFSSSSVASGIALTAAGASTLAAAEKLPSQRYVKTKHIPPHPALRSGRSVLQPDILAKPEKIVSNSSSAAHGNRQPARVPTSFQRTKI